MNKKRIISGIILIVLLLAVFLGGTSLAKYISTFSSSTSAQIAKWKVTESFLVNGKTSTTTPIDLAKSYDVRTLLNGRIAPGTSGNFTVNINAAGTQTGLNYKVTFSNVSTEIDNLTYTYNGKKYTSLDLLEKDLTGTITAEAMSKNVSLEIGWAWPYEVLDSNHSSQTGDAKDSAIGQNESNFGFDVNVTCTQVSPKEAA